MRLSCYNHACIAALFCIAVAAPASAAPATTWNPSLYLANGGYWHHRIALIVTSDAALAGVPRRVIIGDGAQEAHLLNADARSLRVVDDAGHELLYGINRPTGEAIVNNPLREGDVLTVPLECPAHGTRTLFVYYDNDAAGRVPDYLAAGFANGGFEAGQREPAGWVKSGEDAEHKLEWVTEGAHSGRRCVRATATAKTEATWFKYGQSQLPIVPGHQYDLHAWVKAEAVQGTAGWYIHVDGAQPQLINQTLNGGSGSYGWKEVSFRFTAPATAATAELGTVLYGTGTAWYDDCSLAETVATGTAPINVQIGAPESLTLSAVPVRPAWTQRAPVRVPLRVYNFTSEAKPNAVVVLDFRRSLIVSRLGQASRVRVFNAATGRELPALLQDNTLTFAADLPPASTSLFYAYLEPSGAAAGPALAPAALVEGPPNRLQNPDFEQGDTMPAGWTFSAQTPAKEATAAAPQITGRRVAGGKTGGHAVELSIPPGVAPNWAGWHQFVPIEPNGTYFVGAWMKTKDVDGDVAIYVHVRTADKQLVAVNPMAATRPALTGTTDWTWVQTTLTTPADARFLEIHLTSNAHGTIWHDGIVVRRLADTVPAYALALETPPQPGLHVWQVNPMVKVFHDEPVAPDATSLAVSLARNEREPVQLVLKSDGMEPGVNVKVSALTNAAGQALPAVEVARVGYVPVDWPTNYYQVAVPAWYRKIPTGTPSSDGWPGEWPDPLAPGSMMELAANQAQPVWLTIHAPETAAPGVYHGVVSISGAGAPRIISLLVTVHNFALPKRPSLQIQYDLRAPAGAERDLWYRFMAEHRASPSYLPDPEVKLVNGEVKVDFTEFDREAAYCFDDLGMSTMYTPQYFYALGWAYAPKKFMGFEAFTPEWEKAFGSAYRQYIEHVRQKGWLDRITFYLSDEPFGDRPEVIANLQKFSKFVQAIAPGVPVYSSTWKHIVGLNGAVTRWGAGHYGDFPVADIRERQAAGDSFWFTTDGQQCLDTPYAGTERMLSWYCYKYGIKGFEFWGVNWYTYDPWQYGWHKFISQSNSEKEAPYWVRYPNGDGYLAYPGQDVHVAGPASSLRLEAIRDGEEDYEYLVLLRDRIAAVRNAGKPVAAAEAVLARAENLVSIPNVGGLRTSETIKSPDEVLAVRAAVAAAIESLH